MFPQMARVPALLTGKYLTTGRRCVSGREMLGHLPLKCGPATALGVPPENRPCVKAAGDAGMLGHELALQGRILKLSVVKDRCLPAFQD